MSIGLYVHIPFCIRKCFYCDFYSRPLEAGLIPHFIKALAGEMEVRSSLLDAGEKTVDSIYLGGGTPTCLSGDQLSIIFENIFYYFDIAGGAEITVEANPGTVSREKLVALKGAGVNRLSLGFQACQDSLLHTLGRIHSYPEAEEAFKEARNIGFDNISVDLIFGIPGQTPEQWSCCLQKITDLRPDHISAYSLHLEEGTPLYQKVAGGVLEQCTEDLEADMYDYLIDYLGERGYAHYEVSNFSLPGRFSRHNLRYWHNGQYLGIGPAAHSHLGGKRFSNIPALGGYLESLKAGELPVEWEEEPDLKARMSETVFLGLRLTGGLDTTEFKKKFGREIYGVYGPIIERLTGQGLVEIKDHRLCLTRRGLMLGNWVFAEFV
ncbi:MAG: radical SAM family heme chaperone HemW [Desulfocucumaceae bacterium]